MIRASAAFPLCRFSSVGVMDALRRRHRRRTHTYAYLTSPATTCTTACNTHTQSILESMGATGVITPELREALEVLRQRLSLTPEHAQELFYAAAKTKMKPMVEQLTYEFER
jgi:hypothetical protein